VNIVKNWAIFLVLSSVGGNIQTNNILKSAMSLWIYSDLPCKRSKSAALNLLSPTLSCWSA